MSIYDFQVKNINGIEESLEQYKGKALLIVNVASKCGFTPQYKGLQALYETYRDQGFEVLAFPCNQFMGQEPGTNEEIASFCEMNYGVTFPVFAKIDVNGEQAHPLYKYLGEQAPGLLGSRAIKWNFTKFLVDKNGSVLERYAPQASPEDLKSDIEKALQA